MEKDWANSKIDLVDPHWTKNGQNAPSWRSISTNTVVRFEFYSFFDYLFCLKVTQTKTECPDQLARMFINDTVCLFEYAPDSEVQIANILTVLSTAFVL